MSDSKAVQAMRSGMGLCPDEFRGSEALKGVWLAGFMRGYRFKQEEPEGEAEKGEPTDAQIVAALNAYDPRFPGEDLDDFQENEIADMRAALRAAAVQGRETR